MARLNVAVLRGGPSSEYDISLATGAAVLAALSEEKYNTKDLFISPDGEWHVRGKQMSPARALQDIDVAFVALHGEYGEDGIVQKILETYNIPYTGSRAFASALAMDKARAKSQLRGLQSAKLPASTIVYGENFKNVELRVARDVFAKFGPPYIVKPVRGGSSLGVAIADSVATLPDVLDDALKTCDTVLVEQYIRGKETTCGTIEALRGESIYSLPPVEIRVPHGRQWFDFDAKYDGLTEELCPANFTNEEKIRIQQAAKEVHQLLGLRHYSRSDFILAPSGVYFLEVNTLPGITPTSLLPKSLEAVGVRLPEFLDHVVELAKSRR